MNRRPSRRGTTPYTRYTNEQARQGLNTNDPTVAAQHIADELSALRAEIQEIEAYMDRGERLFVYLRAHKPDLLAELEGEAAETVTAFTPLSVELAERNQALQTKMQAAKPVCRRFKGRQQFGDWVFSSRSSGYAKKFDLEKIRAAGLWDLEVDGRPLIKRTENVDPQVWKEAVQKGIVDPEKYSDLYEETPKTRAASIKYIDPHQAMNKEKEKKEEEKDD